MPDDTDLLAELEQYLSSPRAKPSKEYDEVRDIITALRIGDVLDEHPDQTIRILDVGCGKGNGFKILAGRFPDKLDRISYLGIDLEYENVVDARRLAQDLAIVCREPPQFEVGDIFCGRCPAEPKQFDLVLLLNTLHEIPAHRSAELLVRLVEKLRDEGLALIVDMTELPHGEEELCAICWTRPEVIELSQALGFDTTGVDHVRSTGIFGLKLRRQVPLDKLDWTAATVVLHRKLTANLDRLIGRRDKLLKRTVMGKEQVLSLAKVLGEIATTSESLRYIETRGVTRCGPE